MKREQRSPAGNSPALIFSGKKGSPSSTTEITSKESLPRMTGGLTPSQKSWPRQPNTTTQTNYIYKKNAWKNQCSVLAMWTPQCHNTFETCPIWLLCDGWRTTAVFAKFNKRSKACQLALKIPSKNYDPGCPYQKTWSPGRSCGQTTLFYPPGKKKTHVFCDHFWEQDDSRWFMIITYAITNQNHDSLLQYS